MTVTAASTSSETMGQYRQQYLQEFGSLGLPFYYAFWESTTSTSHACEPGATEIEADAEEGDTQGAAFPFGHLSHAVAAVQSMDDENLTFRFKDGDVIVSLAPFATDDLLLPSKLLMEKSPWFKAALSNVWRENKVVELEQADGSESALILRLELVYEPDGGSDLQGRSGPSSELDRLKRDNEVLLEIVNAKHRLYDDSSLDTDVRDTQSSITHQENEQADPFRRTVIESYKIGFALLLGLPYQLSQLPRRFMGWPHDRNETLVVLKLLEFADAYSTLDTMAGGITALILSSEIGGSIIYQYPGTYLRIACILRSRAIFDLALPSAALRNGWWQLQDLGGDLRLEKAVLQAALHLQHSADIALAEMLRFHGHAETEPRFSCKAAAEPDVRHALPIWSCWLKKEMMRSDESNAKWDIIERIRKGGLDTETMVADYNVYGTASSRLAHPELVDAEVIDKEMAEIIEVMREIASEAKHAKALPGCDRCGIREYIYPWEYDDRLLTKPPTTLSLMFDQHMQPQRTIAKNLPKKYSMTRRGRRKYESARVYV